MWRFNEETKTLLRKYAFVFTSKEYSHADRVKIYYLLLAPQLLDYMNILINNSIIEDHREARAEVYLIIDKLIKEYDYRKSSIVPYLNTRLVWALKETLNKHQPWDTIQEAPEEYYTPTVREPYLTSILALTNNKWLTKDLPRSQKSLIVRVLASEDDMTNIKIANKINTSRKNYYQKISLLKEVLAERGIIDVKHR